MFPDKSRHWITGPYESVYYDSWKQWIENSPYTKAQWSPYTFLFWNIRDSAESRNNHDTNTIQLIYSKPDGPFLMKSVNIIVSPDDEPTIREWLKPYYLLDLSHTV